MRETLVRRIGRSVIMLLLAPAAMAQTPMGTAFTYQGQLTKDGSPVTDTCDFEFSLWDDPAAGTQRGPTLSKPGVEATAGLFTVPLDFGEQFNGEARWLELAVKCSPDVTFTTLIPRQALTPAPYSIRAGNGVGGPNALNVTASGDVGIGTTTPAAQLDVNGAARTTTLEIIGGSPFVSPLAGWGNNDYGQTNVPAGTFTAVAGGEGHSLAMRSNATLVGWGRNDNGQINVPAGTFTALSAGYYHGLAIRSDATLAGWGCGNPYNFGQCNVPSGTFTAVAAGGYHSLAIRSDGTLAGWGYNGDGETSVPAGTFTAVVAGSYYALAIRSDGTLVGWGWNIYGQTDVPAGTFTAVAAGYGHSLAVRSDGTLAGWGWNNYGQTDVPAGTFTAVSAGWYHSLAIRSDGTLVGWGLNDYGQIDVPAGTFTAVGAGWYHSLAIGSEAPASPPALLLHSNTAYKPGSNTWTIWSDRRLKKNIEPLSGALERLLQLRGVTFQWLDPASQGGITGTQMGLIADEVQRAFPQWVGRDPKGYQTLTVGGFEALTAEALRELREEKDRQLNEKDCEIAALQARLAALEQIVQQTQAEQRGGGR